jgi:hypothetical protein
MLDNQLWRRDSNDTASDKLGAVQFLVRKIGRAGLIKMHSKVLVN